MDNHIEGQEQKTTKRRELLDQTTKGLKGKIYNYRKRGIIVAIVFLVILVIVLFSNLKQYTQISVKGKTEQKAVATSVYEDFQGNILRYSSDGAFYTDYTGHLIWNETYEMLNPCLEKRGNYVMIYDKNGTELHIMSPTGTCGIIKTTMPIMSAQIGSKGTVAVLMQEETQSHIRMYNKEGGLLASGNLYHKNSGYPIDIALSEDGTKLAVSSLDLRSADVKTMISFYEFNKNKKEESNHMIGSFSYNNLVIPEIVFFDSNRVVAYGDRQIIVYHYDRKPKVSREWMVEGDIKNILYDDKYFGYVYVATNEEGNIENRLRVCYKNGIKKYDKVIDVIYQFAEFTRNHEIIFSNYKDIYIYSRHGINKLAYHSDNSIYKIIPQDTARRYLMITEKEIQNIKLK